MLLNIASALKISSPVFPSRMYPDPLFVIVLAPENILFPALLSFVDPVFVNEVMLPNAQPLRSSDALVDSSLPPKDEDGP